MDKSSNTTSEYEARAEAYRAKAQDIQNWIDCNEADEEEIARALEARDAFEAASERAESLAESLAACSDCGGQHHPSRCGEWSEDAARGCDTVRARAYELA